MVTNDLRAPYGVYLTKKSYDSTALGRRQEESYDFFINFLDIVRCPVKFRYYLKFYGARAAFGRVNEGKMTSAGHRARTASGRRLHTSDGHRTIFVQNLYRTIPTVPVRAPYDVWQAPETFNNLFTSRSGTGRCPSGHRPLFYESNCHR